MNNDALFQAFMLLLQAATAKEQPEPQKPLTSVTSSLLDENGKIKRVTLGIKEVSASYGIGVSKLRELVRAVENKPKREESDIPFRRVGRQILFHIEEFDHWFKNYDANVKGAKRA
jgi:choline kinase